MTKQSSAENNKHKYTGNRLKHIISSLPYAFLSLFTKRDKKLIVFSAMHCRTFDSNSKFLFLHFLNNEKEYTSYFVINDDELRDKLTKEYGNHFIDTRTREGKKIALKAKTWVVSWLDTPLGGMFLKFRRLVIHLGHGTPLKCIGMMEKDGKLLKKMYYLLCQTNISYSLASTPFIADIIQKSIGFSKKHVLINGQPRTEVLFKEPLKLSELNNGFTHVLYAPTWRQHSEIKLFPFDDFSLTDLQNFLSKEKIIIHIRFHPAYEEDIPKEILALENISLFSAKKYPEIMDYLNLFDALITDYSSIYFDYMLLERPMLFLPYDLEDYEKSVGFTMDYSQYTPGAKPTSFLDFTNYLNAIKNNPEIFLDSIKSLNKILNSSEKKPCESLAKFIKEHK